MQVEGERRELVVLSCVTGRHFRSISNMRPICSRHSTSQRAWRQSI